MQEIYYMTLNWPMSSRIDGQRIDYDRRDIRSTAAWNRSRHCKGNPLEGCPNTNTKNNHLPSSAEGRDTAVAGYSEGKRVSHGMEYGLMILGRTTCPGG